MSYTTFYDTKKRNLGPPKQIHLKEKNHKLRHQRESEYLKALEAISLFLGKRIKAMEVTEE